MALPPQIFWSLSLPEWRAMTAKPRSTALSRNAFDALLQRFPDEAHGQ